MDKKTGTKVVEKRLEVAADRRLNNADGDAPLLVSHPGLSGLGAHRSQSSGPGGSANRIRARRVSRVASWSFVPPTVGGCPLFWVAGWAGVSVMVQFGETLAMVGVVAREGSPKVALFATRFAFGIFILAIALFVLGGFPLLGVVSGGLHEG